MRKLYIIPVVIFVLTGLFSCGDFFLDPEPIGRINPDDPEFTGTITGRPEIKVMYETTQIRNNESFILPGNTELFDTQSYTFTIENISSDTPLTLTGDPLVAVGGVNSELFSISQQPSPTVVSGSSLDFTLAFTPDSTGVKTASLAIASNDDDEPSFIINISANAVFNPLGTSLADNFADVGGGLVTIVSDCYLAPRDATAATILIDGAVKVDAGAAFTIYSGVTLDMGNYSIIVDGSLYIEGTDGNRVGFSGTNWGGITVNGNADINGAVFEDSYDSKTGCFIECAGGDVTVTNSRFLYPGTSAGIQITVPNSGTAFCFNNNIFIDTGGTGNQPGIDCLSSIAHDITVSINYNTFIGKSTDGTAIDIWDDNSSAYLITSNIFANPTSSNTYNPAIQIDDINPQVVVELNVYDDDAVFWAGQSPVLTDNLQLAGWSSNTVFNDLSSDDYRMKQTTTYPDLLQANYIAELEGCLTNGHGNEVGAYGNGGWPPDYNE